MLNLNVVCMSDYEVTLYFILMPMMFQHSAGQTWWYRCTVCCHRLKTLFSQSTHQQFYLDERPKCKHTQKSVFWIIFTCGQTDSLCKFDWGLTFSMSLREAEIFDFLCKKVNKNALIWHFNRPMMIQCVCVLLLDFWVSCVLWNLTSGLRWKVKGHKKIWKCYICISFQIAENCTVCP